MSKEVSTLRIFFLFFFLWIYLPLPRLFSCTITRFACSVSVSSVPGIQKEKELLLQGNYPTEFETYLIQNYGIPRNVMEIVLSKKKKK
jgi:hypothetical protein